MTTDTQRRPTRERILEAAAELLAAGGTDAASTRAVSAAAGVQPPALYRLFGDKQGLLDAVAAHGFEEYLAEKRALEPTDDPIEDLRRGWDTHVGFGLAHPAFYVLMYGVVQARRGPPAADEGRRILVQLVERVALAGRLRVPVETAVDLIHVTSVGVTLALISRGANPAEPELSPRAREMVLATITTASGEVPDGSSAPDLTDRIRAHATALRVALAEETAGLTDAETGLLRDWLRRLANPIS
jgi:AcrR family transcriptional regulator